MKPAYEGGERVIACTGCRFFTGEPLALEAAFSGLSSLSSGFASVRSDDGLCLLHERYVAGSSHCASFAPQLPAANLSPQARLRPGIAEGSAASTSTRQS